MNRTKMPCWIAAVLLLLGLVPGHAQAQDSDEAQQMAAAPARVLKVLPLQLGEFSLAYEKMRTERVSNEISLSYLYRSYLNADTWLPEEKRVQGAGIRMSQRKYSNQETGSPYGFFHGFVLGYRFMVFEENVFELPEQDPSDPNSRIVGRLYQNTLDLSYQLGVQFRLSRHFTAEVAGALGGRVKYALANNAGDLLPDNLIGHAVLAQHNSAILVVPLPQLNLSVGYAF